MEKWNLIIDIAKCENCNNCVLAAKDEYVGNTFVNYTKPHPNQGAGVIKILRKVRGEGALTDAAYLPVMCNHCDNSPCIKTGKGAVIKRDDGVIIIDPVKAKGRRDLVDACPYGSIIWNEELQLPQNWIFDAHLLDAGAKQPRCADVCPTGGIVAIKTDEKEMTEIVSEQGLEVLKPELGTRPRVYYRNLYLFNRLFIGGSVEVVVDSRTECAAEVNVVLMQKEEVLSAIKTDQFGEFKFDGLKADSGEYSLELSHDEWGSTTIKTLLSGRSKVFPDIRISQVPCPSRHLDQNPPG